MKKILAVLIAAMLPLAAFADDTAFILNKIESQNSNVKTLSGPFTQTRTVAAAKTSMEMTGNVYYSADGKFSLLYTKPQGDFFIVNGNIITMFRGGKKTQFDISKTPAVSSLSHALLYSVAGKVRSLAAEANADYAVVEKEGAFIVTITARKKEVKGYAKIVLTYDSKSCLLKNMYMEEFTGVSNEYKMGTITKNPSLGEDKFTPTK